MVKALYLVPWNCYSFSGDLPIPYHPELEVELIITTRDDEFIYLITAENSKPENL